MLRQWHFLITAIVFGMLGWSSALYVSTFPAPFKKNIWDAIFVSFAGPGMWGTSILEMLRWFVPHLLFFYLIGDMAEGELQYRGPLVIPLVGSRRLWWLGKITTLFILAVGYTVFGIVTTIIGAAIALPWAMDLSPFLRSGALWTVPDTMNVMALLAWFVSLISSTLFAISLLQITLSVWWRRAFYAFTSISALMLLSWLLGIDNPILVRWLPGSQSMLLRHTIFDSGVPNHSLAWSLGYNIVIVTVVFWTSIWHVHHVDIWNPTADIHLKEER